MPRTRIALAAAPLVILAAGCPNVAPPTGGGTFQLETVVPGANQPVDLAFAPDGRVFFTEKETGRIRIIKDGALLDAPFATVVVNRRSERGLLGIALHPLFTINHWLYIYYSRSTSNEITDGVDEIADHQIVRFNAETDVAPGNGELLVTLPGAGPGNHNGGAIRFGPDGKLYVAIGDLANSANAQDETTLAGKILRYNDDGSIPTDNPFGDADPVFAHGIRNTFGLAFDAEGRLFGNENGSFNHDEINLIEAGKNYGWPDVQGMADDAFGDPIGETNFAAAHADYRDPLVDKADGSVGAAGIAVIPDETYGAGLTDDVLFGEYSNRRILRIAVNSEGGVEGKKSVFVDGLPSRVQGMAFAPDGHLWLATENAIIRLVPE